MPPHPRLHIATDLVLDNAFVKSKMPAQLDDM